jgi:phage/plasmid-associated DNA primase
VFSANQVPRSGDASHAFFRRWLVVPFDRTFEPAEQVPRETLDTRLSDAGELSGVLNRALEVMDRVRREGFTESESMRRAWEEFKTMTDPVAVWLDKSTITAANAWTVKADLIAAYNKAADDEGRAGMTAQAFGRALKRARPGVEETQKTIGDKRVWCYTGIGLRSGDGGPDDDGGARAARDARDSTNCFGNGAESVGDNNRGKRVQRVQGVQDDNDISSSQPNSAQKAAKEGKGGGVETQPANPSLLAQTATEQGEPENDVCREDEEMRRTGIIQSERQVFELARLHFGLEPMRERPGAA